MKFKMLIACFLSCLPMISFSFGKIDVTSCDTPSTPVDVSGVKDSTLGIQSCINKAQALSPATVYFPPGEYKISTTLSITENYITLTTDSEGTAKLDFGNNAGTVIKFQRPSGGMIFHGGVRNLWIEGVGNQPKTAINIVDGSWLTIEHLTIDFWDTTATSSIGIKLNGREGIHIFNNEIYAKQPIVLAKNPNTLTHFHLDVDHFHFADNYTSVISGSPNYHFTLEDGVNVTSSTIDGQNPMAGGCGIITWTNSSAVGFDLKIENVRHEQLDYVCFNKFNNQINIALNTGKLQQLIIDNVRLENSQNHPQGVDSFPANASAIFTSNVESISVRNTSYINHKGTFIKSTNANLIELNNNFMYQNNQNIITNPTLPWVLGTPTTGKGLLQAR